ncbi:MAG: BamA/TamA family outer membrane protein [Gemmatimonadota bacterium]|nr:MAG: BamA/TamA family outer membrane protein [Gemmatimonadota bacterium]
MVILALLAGQPGPLCGQEEETRGLVVRELSFSGNRAIDDATLRMSIGTSRSSAFARWAVVRWIGLGAKRYFNETEFRRDVLRLLLLYRRSGYREATVDTLVRRTEKDVYLRFIIEEGEPVRVTSFQISGVDELIDTSNVVSKLPLRTGDPFDLQLLQLTADSVGMILKDDGFPYPQIFQSFDVDLEQRSADISFLVSAGSRATVESIEVVGTDVIDEDVVRKAMSLRPGDQFSERELYRSQRDLYRLNLFNFVTVGLADTIPESESDTTVSLAVRVSEANLHRIRLGGGYGTIDCFRVLSGWTLYNFLGAGRTLDLSAQFSKIGVGEPTNWGFENNVCPALEQESDSLRKLNYNVSVGLQEPFFLSRRTSAALTFGAEQYTEFRAYLRQSIGGAFAVTWWTPFGVSITPSYSLGRAKTEADPASFCQFLDVCLIEDTKAFQQPRFRATVGLGIVWDRANSVLNPTSGRRITMDFRHADDFLGSDSLIQFTRGVFEYASYHLVTRRSVFAWRVRLGAVGAPLVQLESGESRFIPSEDRMYGGGPNSVRGYAQNELGPVVRVLERVDTTSGVPDSIIRTSASGGNQLILANAEIRFPLPIFSGRVMGSVFVDAGQVADRGDDLVTLSEIKITPGFGIRIATALGPIRLDVGYNPYRPRPSPLYKPDIASGELELIASNYVPAPASFLGKFRLHFSVGQAF